MLIKRVPGFLVAEFQGVLLPLQMPYDFFIFLSFSQLFFLVPIPEPIHRSFILGAYGTQEHPVSVFLKP